MINWIPVAERLPEWDKSDIGKRVAVTIDAAKTARESAEIAGENGVGGSCLVARW